LRRYPWTNYDLQEISVDISLHIYSIVNELWRIGPPDSIRLAADGAEIAVELNGIEPMTSGLQSQRSPN
jgi:hypothetical protein